MKSSKWTVISLVFLSFILVVMMQVFLSASFSCGGGGGDDDDDNDTTPGEDDDDTVSQCQELCEKLDECEALEDFGFSTLEECLENCADLSSTLVACILEATTCEELFACLGTGDDDTTDDDTTDDDTTDDDTTDDDTTDDDDTTCRDTKFHDLW